MSILPYQTVMHLCKNNMMVEPFYQKSKSFGMTYGAAEAGYDVRIAENITLYPQTLGNLIWKSLGRKRPSFTLASTIEQFSIPNDVMAFVTDKSTWARQGLAVQNTCIEPSWKGTLTLELTNHSEDVIQLKCGMPIAQIVFHFLHAATERPYRGKYQNQKMGAQPAIYEQDEAIDPIILKKLSTEGDYVK